ncbi:MAG: nucleotide exchange factor GrpE [Clostridiales bacterium]|nr:nucleotide exchange factor GrpE [Clostridiales bacterium]
MKAKKGAKEEVVEEKKEEEEVLEETKEEEEVLEETKEEVVEEEINWEEKYNESNDKFLRLNAEFMNFKKRTEKEKSDIYKYANEKLMVDLLPVIDNIERALSSIEGADDHKLVLDGVNLIKNNFDEFLKKNGIEAIKAKGEKFDPNLHHAVMTEEDDESEDDTVIDEFQIGYKLNDKVIRPSMVKVSKKTN